MHRNYLPLGINPIIIYGNDIYTRSSYHIIQLSKRLGIAIMNCMRADYMRAPVII